jgi:hypothetical protein
MPSRLLGLVDVNGEEPVNLAVQRAVVPNPQIEVEVVFGFNILNSRVLANAAHKYGELAALLRAFARGEERGASFQWRRLTIVSVYLPHHSRGVSQHTVLHRSATDLVKGVLGINSEKGAAVVLTVFPENSAHFIRNDITAGLDADSELVRGKIFCGDRCDFSDECLEDGPACCAPDGDRSSTAVRLWCS